MTALGHHTSVMLVLRRGVQGAKQEIAKPTPQGAPVIVNGLVAKSNDDNDQDHTPNQQHSHEIIGNEACQEAARVLVPCPTTTAGQRGRRAAKQLSYRATVSGNLFCCGRTHQTPAWRCAHLSFS